MSPERLCVAGSTQPQGPQTHRRGKDLSGRRSGRRTAGARAPRSACTTFLGAHVRCTTQSRRAHRRDPERSSPARGPHRSGGFFGRSPGHGEHQDRHDDQAICRRRPGCDRVRATEGYRAGVRRDGRPRVRTRSRRSERSARPEEKPPPEFSGKTANGCVADATR